MVVVKLGRYSALLWRLALMFHQGSSAADTCKPSTSVQVAAAQQLLFVVTAA